MEDCKCEGFYKTEYFSALKKIQLLREELHDKYQTIETYEILLDKDAMESITVSLKQFKEGKGIPLSELNDAHEKKGDGGSR